MERRLDVDDLALDRGFSRARLSVIALLVATGIAIYLCYLLTVPFLPALAWALALAVIAMPAHRWLESHIKRQTIAAGISLSLVAMFVVVPLVLIGAKLAQE